MTLSAGRSSLIGVNDLRARKKVKVRLALVTAALRLFDERGFDATTIDDIAAAADVSRRTFFRYFRAKEDAYLVDPERKLAIIQEELRTREPGEPTLTEIRRAIAAIARDYASDAELIRLQYRVALKEPTLVAHGMVYQLRWEEALAEAVAADLGVAVATDVRPRVVAHVTVGAFVAAVASWVAGGMQDDPVALATSTFDLVTPALTVLLEGPAAGVGEASSVAPAVPAFVPL